MKEEKIGQIILNLDHYPGEDLYSDGEVEQEMLSVVQDRPDGTYQDAIEAHCNWPFLYHLSHLRENIVRWVPMQGTEKCLEVGSGCGAITGALSEMGGQVDCVDLSLRRSRINAYRHCYADNVRIHVGNFQVVEEELPADYDYIFLIGAFEYGGLYIGGENPYRDFLEILKKHLAPGGRIIIAIENKTGMKYWAGCREDHNGEFFSGLEDYPGGGPARTFTARELRQLARSAGFGEDKCEILYPYPDYKFMHTLFSDRRLPEVGECKTNLCNYDRDRWEIFDEKLVYDMVIRDGNFPFFSNSYICVLGEPIDLRYMRFSNDRKAAYRISTEITGKEVIKRALTKEAWEHLRIMHENEERLQKRYEGSTLEIVVSATRGRDSLVYPLIRGHISLEKVLDDYLSDKRFREFRELFAEYAERIDYGREAGISDLDLVFSNVLVPKENPFGPWKIIDCEWTTERQTGPGEIAYRALYCYLLEDESRKTCDPEKLLDQIGVTPEMAAAYRSAEMEFQKSVTGGYAALGEMRESIGNPVRRLSEMQRGLDVKSGPNARLQIYEDPGTGYSEEESYFPDGEMGDIPNSKTYHIRPKEGCRNLRIDPCSKPCLVKVERLLRGGKPVNTAKLLTNGKSLGGGAYLFTTSDPQIELRSSKIKPVMDDEVEITLIVSGISGKIAGRI